MASSACVLSGIEPDEIDIADDSSEGGLSTGGSDNGTGAAEDDADDADGDPTGDGDGDPGTGDGDGDPSSSGDGDGDPSSTGDGDGDPSAGCLDFSPTELAIGDNPIALADEASQLQASCGGLGPELVASFTAPSDGDWQFTVTSAEFEPVVALVGACVPLDELACASDPATVTETLVAGQVVYVIVDSTQGFGAAVLTVN